jgi:formylglycine-generating enzyme required for sulfatase activity
LAEYYEDLRERLRSGQAILLLDGYDEVPQAEALRRTILAALEDLPRALAAPILLTCRVLGYQEPRWQLSRDTWRRFELSPLSPEKIRSFILAWYRQLAALRKVADPEKPARKLIHDVQRADLAPLAPNPLLLTVIAVVNGAKGEGLPDTRAKLYEEVVDLLLDRWDAGKFQAADGPAFGWRELIGEARLNDIDVKKTLWRVAYEAHLKAAGAQGGADAGAADIPEADLLRALSRLHPQGCLNWANKVIQLMKQRAGLLIESRPGIYRFPHRTFQEYLAGAHLGAELGFVETAAALGGGSGGWWVAIQLAIGRLVHVAGSTDRPLVLVSELCPQASSEEAGEAYWRKVWLAGLCLLEVGPARAEMLELGRRWAPQVRERLAALLTGGHLSPRERAEAGRALGALEDPRPGTGVRDGVPDIDWVGVAPGPFQMGSIKAQDPDAYKDELPQFPCILIGEPYRISRYPVTVAQYGEFMAAGGYSESRYWTEAGWAWRQKREIQGPAAYGPPFETPNHPRVGVSWYEAAAYCLWLSEKLDTKVELPSEAQWERAARHTDGRIYPWGNEFDPARCNMEDAGIGSTSAVGIFPSGAAESGAMDMSGNVLEWCRTEYRKNYEDYEAKVRDDLEGESARVLRGGAFFNDRRFVRCAYRNWFGPNNRFVNIGFRVVSPGL